MESIVSPRSSFRLKDAERPISAGTSCALSEETLEKRSRRAFTLIELLIVVAIIGILAAIAVPNFLNAQTRSKVSRAVSDLKTLETAMEMYRIDNGQYVPAGSPRVPGWVDSWCPNEVRFYRMTTPIAYIASVPRDPFYWEQSESAKQWGWAYDFVNGGWGYEWRINSWGPDGVNQWGGSRGGYGFNCNGGTPNVLYQATNGLRSSGDILWMGPPENPTCMIRNGI